MDAAEENKRNANLGKFCSLRTLFISKEYVIKNILR